MSNPKGKATLPKQKRIKSNVSLNAAQLEENSSKVGKETDESRSFEEIEIGRHFSDHSLTDNILINYDYSTTPNNNVPWITSSTPIHGQQSFDEVRSISSDSRLVYITANH